MPLNRLIVTADDFGYSAAVNLGIDRAFANALVTRASAMANMPFFEEAAGLAHSGGYADRIGIHVVLTSGEPLTHAIRETRFCDDQGTFVGRHAFRNPFLSACERRAIVTELDAQIARCRQAELGLAHLDSHHHVHNEPSLALLIGRFAKVNGIGSVRIARNCGLGIGVTKKIWKTALNASLRLRGVAASRYFGAAEDIAGLRDPRGVAEVMTHPVLDERGRLVDSLRPTLDLAATLTSLERFSQPGDAATAVAPAEVA
jgi:predicted glycoside hydrolase/deacetylase ChbG (UPF0249 family)